MINGLRTSDHSTPPRRVVIPKLCKDRACVFLFARKLGLENDRRSADSLKRTMAIMMDVTANPTTRMVMIVNIQLRMSHSLRSHRSSSRSSSNKKSRRRRVAGSDEISIASGMDTEYMVCKKSYTRSSFHVVPSFVARQASHDVRLGYRRGC